MRASIIFDTLETLKETQRDKALLAALPPGLGDKLLQNTRMDWVPIADHLHVYDAMARAFTMNECLDVWRATMLRAFNGYLAGMVGRDDLRNMHSMLKRGPVGYGTLSRNCGEQTYKFVGERAAEMLWTSQPALLVSHDLYVDALVAKYEAQLIFANATGSVRLKERGNGVLRFGFTW